MTLAEIRFGIGRTADAAKQAARIQWFTFSIRPWFGDRVLPISEEVLVRWRELIEGGRKLGRTFPQPDLFLAATALEHSLTLVTRNVDDFRGTQVTLLVPWASPL